MTRLKEFDTFVALEEFSFALTFEYLEAFDQEFVFQTVKGFVDGFRSLGELEKGADGAGVHAGALDVGVNETGPLLG